MHYTSFTTNASGPKCGPGKIKVTRQGHRRKDGTAVKGASYCAPDRGKPGKGPKTIPTPHRGSLGGPGYTERSDPARHRILNEHVAEYGYASTISALQSRINLGQRTMSKRALAVFSRDKKWVQSKHGSKTMAKKKSNKKRNVARPRKVGGQSKGLRKARAIRGAMSKLGVSKTAANKLYDEGKLTPTGERRKSGKKKSTKKKAAKKRTSKKRSKKRGSKKAAKRSSGRKKATKRSSTRRKKKKCPAKKTATAAARRVQRGQKGRSGRPLANARWCRNFMDLDVDEKDLHTA